MFSNVFEQRLGLAFGFVLRPQKFELKTGVKQDKRGNIRATNTEARSRIFVTVEKQ
jgi:hypothetical protein